MASYPTSVPSLGTANTGDSIAAAHVNDLRREVEAVINALLGTIAHALTVNANVTLSGTTTSVQSALAVSGATTIASGTATPAGGSTTARLVFGTTSGFGIYYGSGAPSVSAAQGSVYLRSDGSSTSTRLYVNTDGGTTWTAVTTAA